MPLRTMRRLDQVWLWGLLSFASMAGIYALSDRPASDYESTGDFLSWLPFSGTIAHIGLYFVLSVFVFRTFAVLKSKRIGPGMTAYLTVFVALVYGILDEIHQTNVEGRSSEVADVVADVFGGVLAVVFWFGVKRWQQARSEKRSGN